MNAAADAWPSSPPSPPPPSPPSRTAPADTTTEATPEATAEPAADHADAPTDPSTLFDPAVEAEMQGRGLVPGFYGSMRARLPFFALEAVLIVLLGLIPYPADPNPDVYIASLIFFAVLCLAFFVPWESLPDYAWLVVPVGFLAVIALIRNAQGGSTSGLIVVYLLPIVWLALYGRRIHLAVGLVCMYLALVIPILVVGTPRYPSWEWRQTVAMAAVTTLVSATVMIVVSKNRAYVTDLVRQTRLARRSALDADQARDRLETLLRAATGSAIMGVDPSGTVTFFSAGAEQMLGYTAAEVVGLRSIAYFIDPAQIDERRQTIDALRNTAHEASPEAVAEVPWTATRKDGTKRRCVVRVRAMPTPVVDSSLGDGYAARPATPPDAAASRQASTTRRRGAEPEVPDPPPAGAPSVVSYVVVAIDVTEREDLAAERERVFAVQREVTQSFIQQNRRLRELTKMKDDVVATVSHELRTPITSIRGFVELLLEDAGGLTDEQVRMLRTIDRSSVHLQRVAEDLLADPGGGRGLSVAFTELDLGQLAAETVDSFQTSATTAGVALSWVPIPSVPGAPGASVPVFGDPTRLRQLVGNLVSNAIKFSPRGGRVKVVVDAVDAFARVQVLDEGPGIPESERPQLFERFYRLASTNESGVPGTGLGLAIAKTVAEAHEGFVDIVDTPGWSTTFRVFLPLHPTEHPASEPSAPADTRSAATSLRA
ncbi:MAG: ATP-binding protein [Acidimicrobiales bacterium]